MADSEHERRYEMVADLEHERRHERARQKGREAEMAMGHAMGDEWGHERRLWEVRLSEPRQRGVGIAIGSERGHGSQTWMKVGVGTEVGEKGTDFEVELVGEGLNLLNKGSVGCQRIGSSW